MLKNILTHCCRRRKPHDIITIYEKKNSIKFIHHATFLLYNFIYFFLLIFSALLTSETTNYVTGTAPLPYHPAPQTYAMTLLINFAAKHTQPLFACTENRLQRHKETRQTTLQNTANRTTKGMLLEPETCPFTS